MRPFTISVLAFTLTASVAEATGPGGQLSVDLARYYFPSAEAEQADRARLERELARLESYRGRLANEASTLAEALQLYQDVQKIYYRHILYLDLRCSRDRRDSDACNGEGVIEAEFDARTAFLASELAQLSDDRLREFVRSNPALTSYQYLLQLAHRSDPTDLTLSAREATARLRPQILGWQWPFYQNVTADAPYAPVTSGGRSYDVRRDRAAVLAGGDRDLRERMMRAYWQGLHTRRDLVGFTLIRTASAADALARQRGFANSPDASYFDRLLDPASVRALLAELEGRGSILKRYSSLRSAGPALWDTAATPAHAPSYRLDEIRAIYRRAFVRLDPAFSTALDSLLDPAQGRADIAEQAVEGRAGGGFSLGFPGTDAVLFVGRFGGTFRNLSNVAHEGTHAAQRALMNAHGVLPSYTSGPNYLMEATAIFSELVLADHMYRSTRDPILKRYYLERFLDIKGLVFLYAAEEALFEQRVHDGVGAGTITQVDDIDRIWSDIDRHFGDDVSTYPETREGWMTRALAFEDPLYYVNYVYAGLIGLELFRQFKRNPADFAPRYERFLERGFDGPPATLLEQHFGIAPDLTHLVGPAIQTISERLDELEAMERSHRNGATSTSSIRP